MNRHPKTQTFTINCVILATVCCLVAGCGDRRTPFGTPGEPLTRAGDEIVVCGELFHTGSPVVLWMDPGGYDAYRAECRFTPNQALPTRAGDYTLPNRYNTFRENLPESIEQSVRERGWTREELAECVDLFLIHYDVCGVSRQCFKVLHDIRGMSVHFLLDVDGTIYQTMDVKERPRQTGPINDRSIGIEIANIGAYRDMTTLDKWYAADEAGRVRQTLPAWLGDGGVRTPDFVARPARNEPVHGNIQGQDLIQYDFTDEQYESLIKLAATLSRALPGIKPVYPLDEKGSPVTGVLSAEELAAYRGWVGHYHVTSDKIDPGPAFDWDRLAAGVKRELSR